MGARTGWHGHGELRATILLGRVRLANKEPGGGLEIGHQSRHVKIATLVAILI